MTCIYNNRHGYDDRAVSVSVSEYLVIGSYDLAMQSIRLQISRTRIVWKVQTVWIKININEKSTCEWIN